MSPQPRSAFDQRLLRAARAELPAEGAEERALAALGLASVMVPETSSAGGRRASSSPGPVETWSLKWVATALVAGGSAILAATWAPAHATPAVKTSTRAASAPALDPPAAADPLPATRPTAAAPPPVPTALSAPATKPLPAARTLMPASSPVSSRAVVSPPDSTPDSPRDAKPTTLSSEVVLVQRATRTLALGDPGSALAILNTYENRYPHGVLAPEAGYLRVQVLLARGDRAAAIDLASRLFAADPKGVLAPKLEAVMESDEKPIP